MAVWRDSKNGHRGQRRLAGHMHASWRCRGLLSCPLQKKLSWKGSDSNARGCEALAAQHRSARGPGAVGVAGVGCQEHCWQQQR